MEFVVNNVNASINIYDGLGQDLLWGVDAIAGELGLNRRQTHYQLETGKLPARKQAGKWIASRSGLRRYFASVIAGELA